MLRKRIHNGSVGFFSWRKVPDREASFRAIKKVLKFLDFLSETIILRDKFIHFLEELRILSF